jgi:hypothetical protein
MKMREMIMTANGCPPGNNKYSGFGVRWVKYDKILQMNSPKSQAATDFTVSIDWWYSSVPRWN